jgi:hypothetical protein
MNFTLEPPYWLLLLTALIAAISPSCMRRIGRTRAIALLVAWAGAEGTSWALYGSAPALISTGLSLLAGGVALVASLVWSGVKSMPNRRFEER